MFSQMCEPPPVIKYLRDRPRFAHFCHFSTNSKINRNPLWVASHPGSELDGVFDRIPGQSDQLAAVEGDSVTLHALEERFDLRFCSRQSASAQRPAPAPPPRALVPPRTPSLEAQGEASIRPGPKDGRRPCRNNRDGPAETASLQAAAPTTSAGEGTHPMRETHPSRPAHAPRGRPRPNGSPRALF